MTETDNFAYYPDKPRQKRKKGRANVEKRAGAREVVRTLQWLSYPRVYWSGAVPDIPFREKDIFRPIQFLIGEKMKELPRGVYALELKYDGEFSRNVVNPEIECYPLTDQLIVRTARALQAARKYPRALPKVIPDPQKWLREMDGALKRVAVVRKAVSNINGSVAGSLAIEENCLWLGTDKDHPTGKILVEDVISCLKEIAEKETPGKRLAAVILGANRKGSLVPGTLKLWSRLGTMLSSWPPDIVTKFKLEKTISSSDLSILKELNHTEVVPALWERVMAGQPLDMKFFKHLLELKQAGLRLASEPRRRIQALIQIVDKTIRNIRDQVEEDSITSGEMEEISENRIQFFADIFISLYMEFMHKQGISVNLKKLSNREVLEFAYWYSLDTIFPLIFFRNRRWRTIFNELQRELDAFLQKTGNRSDLSPVLTAMAVRMAELTKKTECIKNLIPWLEMCRIYWFRDEERPEPAALALQLLETGWVASKGDPSNLDRFCFLLSEQGHFLLGHDIRWILIDPSPLNFNQSSRVIREWMITMRVISRYGTLGPDQCRFVIDHNMIYSTRSVMGKGIPDALLDYVQWLEHQDETWLKLTLHYRLIWTRLFRLPDRTLVRFLSNWASQTVKEYRLTWVQMSLLLNSVLRFCVSESNLDDDPYEPDDYADEKERQQFIRDHVWVLQAMIDSIKKIQMLMDDSDQSSEDIFDMVLYNREPVLSVSYFWTSQSLLERKKMVTRLLNHCYEKEKTYMEKDRSFEDNDFMSGDSDFQKLMVVLSEGKVTQLLNFLDCPVRDEINYRKLIQGWEYAHRFPGVCSFLASRFQKIKFQIRVFRILNLLETARLLPEKKLLCDFFKQWETFHDTDTCSFPHPLSPDIHSLWQEYVYYQSLAEEQEPITEKIQKIIDLPPTLENEHQNLLKKKEKGTLDESARKRLIKLTALLENSDEVTGLISQRLSQLLTRQIPLVKMDALEKGIKKVIQDHWQTIVKARDIDVDDPDWDNALWLYLGLKKNRRLLKRLLKQVAQGDPSRIRNHPGNQKFLQELIQSGADVDIWLSGIQKKWKVNGQDWTVYLETDPLKVFHMGNLFNTCLQVGGLYDYSVVSNAVEVNKQVLYLRNETGRILGRKLVLLRKDGTLFGCHSYGSADSYDYEYGGSPWVKICFDLFCLELVKKCKLKFPAKDDSVSKEDFQLFSQWYFDGTERFDPWVTDWLDSEKQKNQSLLPVSYKDIHRSLVGDRDAEDDLLRLLIWLGDDLMPVIEKVMNSPIIEKDDIRYIFRFTESKQVKKRIKEDL